MRRSPWLFVGNLAAPPAAPLARLAVPPAVPPSYYSGSILPKGIDTYCTTWQIIVDLSTARLYITAWLKKPGALVTRLPPVCNKEQWHACQRGTRIREEAQAELRGRYTKLLSQRNEASKEFPYFSPGKRQKRAKDDHHEIMKGSLRD